QKEDFSEDIVVIDAKGWRNAEEKEADRIQELSLLTHELAHPLIERARWASGASDRLNNLGSTPSERAIGLAYGIAGEYHADRVSFVTMGELASVSINGERKPLTKWPYIQAFVREDLAELLERTHRVWPELV